MTTTKLRTAGRPAAKPAASASELDGYTVRVARSFEEIDDLRSAWLELLGSTSSNLRADPDYYLTVLRHKQGAQRPHIVLFERQGRPELMIVGRIEELKLAYRLGFTSVYEPKVRALTVVQGGFLGEIGEREAELLVDELQATLGRREAEVACLVHMTAAGPVYETASRRPPRSRRYRSEPQLSRRLRLPGSMDEFLQSWSSHARKKLKYQARRLEREYGDALRIELFRDRDQLDRLFADTEQVAAKTYQWQLGAAFQDTPFQRAIVELAMDKGWFRAYVLYLEDRPVAFWQGIGYAGVFRVGTPAYDPSLASLSVGTYVLLHLISDLCADESIRELDYGFGDAEYKQRFSDEQRYEGNVIFFAPTPRAVWIKLVMTTLSGVQRLVRRIPGGHDLVGRLKRAWRGRLVSRGTSLGLVATERQDRRSVTVTTAPERAGYSVRVARSVEELEELRPAWLELQGEHITSDPDYFATLVGSEPRVHRPHVVLVERDGRPALMVVGRIEDRELTSRLGYKRVYSPRVRSLTVSYGGFLGDVGEQEAAFLVDELLATLARGEAEVVYILRARADGPVYRAAALSPPFLTRQHGGRLQTCWRLTLPSSLDELLRSRSSHARKKLKYQARRLERECGDALSRERFVDQAQLDRFFEDVEQVAAKTYQRQLGAALRDTPLQRRLIELAMDRGWFRGYLLYLEGRPVAFWYGLAYEGTFRLATPAYDPSLARLSVGTYVLMWLIDDLCADPTVQELDFGFGDAEYKRRFAEEAWSEGDVYLFGPTLRARRINLSLAGLHAADALARRVASSGGRLASVKRAWRRRLGGGQSE